MLHRRFMEVSAHRVLRPHLEGKNGNFVPASFQAPKSGFPCPDRSENVRNGKGAKFYFDIVIQKKSQNFFVMEKNKFEKYFSVEKKYFRDFPKSENFQ